jgi:hypothetical protein
VVPELSERSGINFLFVQKTWGMMTVIQGNNKNPQVILLLLLSSSSSYHHHYYIMQFISVCNVCDFQWESDWRKKCFGMIGL